MKFEIRVVQGHMSLVRTCMSPKNEKQAWKMTIQKWELLVMLTKLGILVRDGGVSTCGLCMLYTSSCKGCPIATAGYRVCRGTPYEAYMKAVEDKSAIDGAIAAAGELELLKRIKRDAKSQAKETKERKSGLPNVQMVEGQRLWGQRE